MTKQVCKNVSITPAMDRFIAERVTSGRYQNASEVVRASLRLLQEKEGVASATSSAEHNTKALFGGR